MARDPAGLDRPGQSSSAYDLALFGRAALQLPAFVTYVTTKPRVPRRQRARTAGRGGRSIINNHNRLLYNYPGTIGVKNGYTVAARQTFIGAASRGGHTYLVHRDGRHQRQLARPKAALLDWAFAHGASLHRWAGSADPGSARPPERRGAAPAAGSGTPAGPGAGPAPRVATPRPRARWPPPADAGLRPAPAQRLWSVAPASPLRRCWDLLAMPGAPASPAAAAAPQISSFCLICSLSPAHRLVYPQDADAKTHSASSDHA